MSIPDRLLLPASAESFDVLVLRARSEFMEMPGLKLTASQAARLWHLDGEACRRVLSALEEAHFLVRSSADAYGRP